MSSRISHVSKIDILSIGDSNVFIIGDSKENRQYAQVFAIQREQVIFFEREYPFHRYKIFSSEIPQPIIDEDIEIIRFNESPFIRVQHIMISSVAASSIVQIGSNETVESKSRVKTVRHLAH